VHGLTTSGSASLYTAYRLVGFQKQMRSSKTTRIGAHGREIRLGKGARMMRSLYACTKKCFLPPTRVLLFYVENTGPQSPRGGGLSGLAVCSALDLGKSQTSNPRRSCCILVGSLLFPRLLQPLFFFANRGPRSVDLAGLALGVRGALVDILASRVQGEGLPLQPRNRVRLILLDSKVKSVAFSGHLKR